MKTWLRARPTATTIDELNALLTQFRSFYNHDRPHRALTGATPAEAFNATAKAHPVKRPVPEPLFVSRHTVNPGSGSISVPPYIVNVGRRWIGHSCDCIRDGQHIVIFSGTTIVRELTADPNHRYQRNQRKPGTHGKREPKPAP